MSSLSQTLRESTASIHERAERSGFVADMLTGRVSDAAYQLYLRNLYEIYFALERGWQDKDALPWSARLLRPELKRASAIASDLERLSGSDWRDRYPLLTSTIEYRERIEALIKEFRDAEVAAHLYVRYLGDLSGGQVLARRLAGRSALPEEALSFYRFDDISDTTAAKHQFRQSLDALGAATVDPGRAADEAQLAFQHNIDLSCEVRQWAEAGR